jgi:hypothetical protein
MPIVNWNNEVVLNYLEMAGLPTIGLYKKYGISGCSWCPFYGPEIYYVVLQQLPDWHVYRRVIELDEELGSPSVTGGVFLRDIRAAVLEGAPCPAGGKVATGKPPCMTSFEGRMVPTCEVYGHIFIDGVCYRCGQKE